MSAWKMLPIKDFAGFFQRAPHTEVRDPCMNLRSPEEHINVWYIPQHVNWRVFKVEWNLRLKTASNQFQGGPDAYIANVSLNPFNRNNIWKTLWKLS